MSNTKKNIRGISNNSGSRREKFNKIFNPEQEKELDIDLEDLYVDSREKDNYLEYEENSKLKTVEPEDLDKNLQKYKPKQISFEDWKKKENEEDLTENEEEKDENDNEKIEEENEIEEEEEEVKLPTKKKTNGTANNKNDKQLVNQTINMMDKEDEVYLEQIMKVKTDDIKKGKSVSDQKKVFDSLVGLRIYIQNIMKDINKFPQNEKIIDDVKNDENLSSLYQMTSNSMNNLVSNLLSFNKELNLKGNFQNLLKESNQNIDITDEFSKIIKDMSQQDDLSSENIFNEIEGNFDKLINISERVINIWYRKTLIYTNKQNNKLLKVLNANNFCEHIKKSIEDNYDTIRLKTKRKREKFKVLGKSINSLIEEEDDNIYDDSDFYEFLLKEFFSSQELEESQNLSNRYDLTMQYLLNRKNKFKENKKDQKATKNRKLRFDQHDKIMNFMTPEPNLNELGRDEIVASLFGGKKIKRVEEREELDVALI